MLPPEDGLPQRRFPIVNVTLIALNVAVFMLFELPHPRAAILHASFYPASLTGWQGPLPWYLSWLTAMFLHAGWSHLLGNMLFLWVFGDSVELAFGRARYLAFYLAGGFAAIVVLLVARVAWPAWRQASVRPSGATAAPAQCRCRHDRHAAP